MGYLIPCSGNNKIQLHSPILTHLFHRTFPVIFSGREVMAAAGSKWAIFVGNFGNLDRFAGRLRFPWRENWDFFVRKFGDLEERRFPRTTANLSTSWLQWENFLKKMIEIEVKVSCSLSSFLLNYIIECEIVKNVKDWKKTGISSSPAPICLLHSVGWAGICCF